MALAAVDEVLALSPRDFLGLLMKASLIERQGHVRGAGAAYGIALTQAPAFDALDPPTRRAAEHARAAFARYNEDLAATLAASVSRPRGSSEESVRLQVFQDRLTGRRKIYNQAPAQFYYPGLPAIEFYDRSHFPWLPDVEAASDDIRREFQAAMAQKDTPGSFTPYVEYPPWAPVDQWAELNHSPRWTAYHLMKNGERLEDHCATAPKTLEAVAHARQPRARNRSPNAMYSLLQPRTRIPPHTGVSNTRLVTHLPLEVPDNCGFRVGSSTRPWVMGEAFVFDDTIEHEAWNESDRWRAVLIFDVWSPFLSETEREGIVEVMSAMDAFHGQSADFSL